MRPFLVPASLLLMAVPGCRAPAIPTAPALREYAVWHDVLRREAETTNPHRMVVAPQTLRPDEQQLQFQRCLPRHMRNLFDGAPSALLSRNVPEDWLTLSDRTVATLSDSLPPASIGNTVQVRLSRVAFSRFHRDGYVWVEHKSCDATEGGRTRCLGSEGRLLRATPDGDRWKLEETECRASVFGADS